MNIAIPGFDRATAEKAASVNLSHILERFPLEGVPAPPELLKPVSRLRGVRDVGELLEGDMFSTEFAGLLLGFVKWAATYEPNEKMFKSCFMNLKYYMLGRALLLHATLPFKGVHIPSGNAFGMALVLQQGKDPKGKPIADPADLPRAAGVLFTDAHQGGHFTGGYVWAAVSEWFVAPPAVPPSDA